MCSGVGTGVNESVLDRQMTIANLRKKIIEAELASLEAQKLLSKMVGDGLGEEPPMFVISNNKISRVAGKDSDLGGKEAIIELMKLKMKCLEMAKGDPGGFVPNEEQIISKAKAFYDFLKTGGRS